MDFGRRERAKVGRPVCGDGHLILDEGSQVVVAVADGLGSGTKAQVSSQLAIHGVAENTGHGLTDILTYCHYSILSAGGVGVMMAVMRLNKETIDLDFAGVGNIRFQAHSHDVIQPIVRYGYLGVRLPSLRAYHFVYTPGDVFILHTDGISSRFHLHNYLPTLEQGAQALADLALSEHGKSHDDATIVVVRT